MNETEFNAKASVNTAAIKGGTFQSDFEARMLFTREKKDEYKWPRTAQLKL